MMYDAFSPIGEITEAIDEIQNSSNVSTEIKEYAAEVYDSLQIVFKKFNKMAVEIEEDLSVTIKKIKQSEDTWKAKLRISQIATEEIWHEIGRVSGCIYKIKELKTENQRKTIEKIQDSWRLKSNALKDTFYSSSKNYLYVSISPKSSNTLNKDIKKTLNVLSEEINYHTDILRRNILKIYKNGINQERINEYLFLESPKIKEHFKNKMKLIKNTLNTSYSQTQKILEKHLHDCQEGEILRFIGTKSLLQFNKLSDYEKFEGVMQEIIAKVIQEIFDEKLKVSTSILEDILSFYYCLLEQQQRYRQESEEMRKAEKEWIDKQYDRLQKSSQKLLKVVEVCDILIQKKIIIDRRDLEDS